jgi:hypothetical protein
VDPDRATPYTDPFDDPTHWPLHQRLLGALVRAGGVTLGFLPVALFLLASEGFDWAIARLVGVGFVVAVCVLGFERRDARWWWVFARLAAAGVVAAIVTPLTWLWLENLGDPAAAYGSLGRMLRRGRLTGFLALALLMAIYAGTCGLLVYVRAKTTRLPAFVAAGLLTLLFPITYLLTVSWGDGLVWALVLAVTGVAVPLGLAFGDRLAKRIDPNSPSPPDGSSLRPTFAVAGVIAIVALEVPLFGANPYSRPPGGEVGAIGALRTLTTAQALFREGDKDGDGILNYAASLTELGEQWLIDDRVKTGVRGGYVFRLLRSASEPEFRWTAAADPIAGSGHRRHFAVNHNGVIHQSLEPIALDPIQCELPDDLEPLGTPW